MNITGSSFEYKADGKLYTCHDFAGEHFFCDTQVSGSRLKIVIQPRTKIELIRVKLDISRDFQDGEVFFANGYQAWTTSREFTKDDIQRGIGQIAKITRFTKELAATSGDYLFAEYPGKRGMFHSFTYTYFRNGTELELWGSLSERQGYTVFGTDMNSHAFCMEKDVEGLIIDSAYVLFDTVYFSGTYDEVFDSYFAAMDLPKPRTELLTGYTSWYNYFQNINQDIILRDLKGMERAGDRASVFQIDDGYEVKVGDWLEQNPKDFPNGMKPIADAIHKAGYQAGIWLAPFNGQKDSKIVRVHPEWLIRDNRSGKPLLGCFAWGGAYTFDVYNEGFRAHLKHVFDVVLNEWGYDMVKLDFLYSQCMQPRYGKTRGTIMCEAMDFLRECVGEKLILGCGVPLGAAFGTVDACRISCDVDLKYGGKYYNKLALNNELPCACHAINNTIFRRHLNQRAFLNDPDVFFLRDKNLKFTSEQKLLLAKINNLFGNVLFVSDNAGDYDAESLQLLKRFFTKTDAVIHFAGRIDSETIEIRYTEKTEKCLRFNLKTGQSNIQELL